MKTTHNNYNGLPSANKGLTPLPQKHQPKGSGPMDAAVRQLQAFARKMARELREKEQAQALPPHG